MKIKVSFDNLFLSFHSHAKIWQTKLEVNSDCQFLDLTSGSLILFTKKC